MRWSCTKATECKQCLWDRIAATSLGQDRLAKLWKNGVATNLTDGLSPAGARRVAVQGSDVYVVGSTSGGMTVWKNGIASALGDSRPALATGVVVHDGDVFVSGGVNGGGGDMAAVWRDGVLQTFTDGAYQAFADSLAVASKGVYAVGYEGPCAMLWVNGAPHRLSDGRHGADALDVAVVEH